MKCLIKSQLKHRVKRYLSSYWMVAFSNTDRCIFADCMLQMPAQNIDVDFFPKFCSSYKMAYRRLKLRENDGKKTFLVIDRFTENMFEKVASVGKRKKRNGREEGSAAKCAESVFYLKLEIDGILAKQHRNERICVEWWNIKRWSREIRFTCALGRKKSRANKQQKNHHWNEKCQLKLVCSECFLWHLHL